MLWYYQNKSNVDCSQKSIKPTAQVILILTQDGRLTTNDLTTSALSINTIKSTYPGTRIIYVTSRESTSIRQLIVDKDDTVLNFSNDVVSLVTAVIDKLSDVPSNIVKFYCNHTEIIFEDYITPYTERLYEIHSEYLRRGHFNVQVRKHTR